ncbi:LOW QUALITY PROTEIN: glycoside hydrolase family 47 protein [Colletotrichum tofieldiae]|nr:LOW QUALITY PROTEIN: glycoside hydrolase family 47 protein [Colletotrichum tofieldiae]
MNVRDPFNLHRNTALNVFKVTASRAAQNIKEKAVEAGATALNDMAFNVPKNVPSFSNPQRVLEDRYWGASAPIRPWGNSGIFHGVQGRVEDLLGTRGQLPMYKDKPYAHHASRRFRPLWRRKRSILVTLLLLFSGLWFFGFFSEGSKARESASTWTGWLGASEPTGKKVDWLKRRERVVEAFELSWDAYERYAWGNVDSGNETA